jgi:Transcriptional regulator, AbiEi antitoxin, Type IV TA system
LFFTVQRITVPRLTLDPTEGHLLQALVNALRALPDVEAHVVSEEVQQYPDAGYDIRIDMKVAGRPLTMFVAVKKTVYPRDVHQALWRLKPLKRQDKAHNSIVLVAAASLSPGAKELLRAEGLGYFDSGGSLCVPAAGAYIFIDKPPPKTQVSAMRSLFTGRRAQAIHALLIRREHWLGVKELAGLAHVSPATASEVLTELEKFEWIEVRGQGPNKERHLRDPRALLDAWAAQVVAGRAPAMRRYFVPGLKADALVDRIAQAFEARNVSYAVSHEAAAQRYAPYLSSVAQVRCRVLVAPETNDGLADLGARPVSEGANLVLIDLKSPDDLMFRERVGHAWLASPIHVYLDLLKGEGRAKEMAEHLRKEKIGC